MKSLSKLCLLLTCMGGIDASLEAKDIEIHFQQTLQEAFDLQSKVDDETLKGPKTSKTPLFFQNATVENKGDRTLIDCAPYFNQSALWTKESLTAFISQQDEPLLALYQFWKDRVPQVEGVFSTQEDPLYLINYVGGCDKEQQADYFSRLCAQVGFTVKPAIVHGIEGYDVYANNTWQFIDPTTGQVYVGFDNNSLVSSEAVADDPLLALRTKCGGKEAVIDFAKAWSALACFEIASPAMTEELSISVPTEAQIKKGFDLFSGEKLHYHYKTEEQDQKKPSNQCFVDHILKLDERPDYFQYTSPAPIYSISNQSDKPIIVVKENRLVLPSETYLLKEEGVFELEIAKESKGELCIRTLFAQQALPKPHKGQNTLYLGSPEAVSSVNYICQTDSELEKCVATSIKITNEERTFDHCTPFFTLETQESAPEKVWWQISKNEQFQGLLPNFEQVESYQTCIQLPIVTDSFFNANTSYYFRIKGEYKGVWSEWSAPFQFNVQKPHAIKAVEFEKLGFQSYQLSWEKQEGAEYLIFGSNALDFIPAMYFDKQINAIVNQEAVDEETASNFLFTTQDSTIKVDGAFAYYRIIARKNGQLSSPSPLVHVYDNGLKQARTVLQLIEMDEEKALFKRMNLPSGYEWEGQDQESEARSSPALFPMPSFELENNLQKIQSQLLKTQHAFAIYTKDYPINPYVPAEVWAAVSPLFLPENHPIKPKLDRMFSSTRVTLTPDTFRRAGFKRFKPGRFSRIMASSHPNMPGYFIKAFSDLEAKVVDWQKLMRRIAGSFAIRECIKRNGLEAHIKVPQKWIYPLPVEPSPPNTDRYFRKNFILVAEDVQAYSHSENEKKYKRISKERLKAFYIVANQEGLWDSCYAFNAPFCKDGKIAFIDTEYFHKWPVPFHKLNRYLSTEMQGYLKHLIVHYPPIQPTTQPVN